MTAPSERRDDQRKGGRQRRNRETTAGESGRQKTSESGEGEKCMGGQFALPEDGLSRDNRRLVGVGGGCGGGGGVLGIGKC